MKYTEADLNKLTTEQLAEIEEKRRDVNISPIEFIKWLYRKLKEWLEQ